jgi:deazaflavin-dependent oxidoreductase (nitroreductase family)
VRRVATFVAIPAAVIGGFLVLVRFRRRSVARFNRVATNRITSRFAAWAPGFAIVVHRGRRSGRLYRTPVNVFKIPEGFLIALTYGRESEWVRNVLGAGGCLLQTRGTLYQCATPAIVHDPGHRRLPLLLRLIPRIGGVTDYLQLTASPALLRS